MPLAVEVASPLLWLLSRCSAVTLLQPRPLSPAGPSPCQAQVQQVQLGRGEDFRPEGGRMGPAIKGQERCRGALRPPPNQPPPIVSLFCHCRIHLCCPP